MHDQLDAYKVGTHNRELFDVDVGTARALFNKVKDAMRTMGLTEGCQTAIDVSRLTTLFQSQQVEVAQQKITKHISSGKNDLNVNQHKNNGLAMPKPQPVVSTAVFVDSDYPEELALK
eukprot:3932970-Rhodomonas_salina.1